MIQVDPRHASGTFGAPLAQPRCYLPVLMAYDPALVDRVDTALPRLGARGVRQKHVFGGRGFLLGRSTYAIVWGEGLLVKVPAGEYATALAEPGVTPFAPDGGRPMGTWVVVPAERVADDPELADWVARGLRTVA